MLSAAWRLPERIFRSLSCAFFLTRGRLFRSGMCFLPHSVVTARETGWATLANGELLRVADAEFDVLITTDKNLRYQQRTTGRRIAVVVLPTTSWPRIRRFERLVIEALTSIEPGQLVELHFPDR